MTDFPLLPGDKGSLTYSRFMAEMIAAKKADSQGTKRKLVAPTRIKPADFSKMLDGVGRFSHFFSNDSFDLLMLH